MEVFAATTEQREPEGGVSRQLIEQVSVADTPINVDALLAFHHVIGSELWYLNFRCKIVWIKYMI